MTDYYDPTVQYPHPNSRIAKVKEVRERDGIGLREAKDKVLPMTAETVDPYDGAYVQPYKPTISNGFEYSLTRREKIRKLSALVTLANNFNTVRRFAYALDEFDNAASNAMADILNKVDDALDRLTVPDLKQSNKPVQYSKQHCTALAFLLPSRFMVCS